MSKLNIHATARHLREMTYARAKSFLGRLVFQGVIDSEDYQTLWADYLAFHRRERAAARAARKQNGIVPVAEENSSETVLTEDGRNPPYYYLKPKAFAKKMLDLQSSGKITGELRVRYVQMYEQHRKQTRSMTTHRNQARRHWLPIREQLAAEIASVRTGIHYYRKDPGRNASFEDRKRLVENQRLLERYLTVLSRTLLLIKNATRAGTTPLQLVDLMEQDGKHVPNRGEHWVDWVSPKVKSGLLMEYTSLPRLPRTKFRHLFERKVRTITRSTADQMAMYNEFNSGETSHQNP